MRKLIVGLWTCFTVAVAAVDGAEVIPGALYAPKGPTAREDLLRTVRHAAGEGR